MKIYDKGVSKKDDIKKQLKKQNNEVYGESTVSGSAPDPSSDDDVEQAVKDTFGSNINPADVFHLADEVQKDKPKTDKKENENNEDIVEDEKEK